jgi:hypothetical protein
MRNAPATASIHRVMDPWRSARERLQFFVDQGLLDAVPTSWQIAAGTIVMLPVVLGETPRGRAMSRRTILGQIPLRAPLQMFYCPPQAVVGSGLTASRETVVRHVLSVYHEDGMLTYDLQLVQSHPGGLDDLERRARAVVAGRGLLSRFLTSLVGGPGYHARVVELCVAARRFEYAVSPSLDARFATLTGFANFCRTLPTFPGLSFYGLDWRSILSPREVPDESYLAPSPAPAPAPRRVPNVAFEQLTL